jgi:hypothetical protein
MGGFYPALNRSADDAQDTSEAGAAERAVALPWPPAPQPLGARRAEAAAKREYMEDKFEVGWVGLVGGGGKPVAAFDENRVRLMFQAYHAAFFHLSCIFVNRSQIYRSRVSWNQYCDGFIVFWLMYR